MTSARWRGLGFGFALAGGAMGGGEVRAQATEGATPVAVGSWRVDADVYVRAEDWKLPEGWGGRGTAEASWVQVATGVADGLDVQVGWQAYQKFELDGEDVEGLGDLFVAAKWRLAGNEAEGAAWALMPYVKLPTAGGRFTDDTVDAGVFLIFGRPWGETGYVNAQLGWDDYGDGAGGRDQGASASAAAGLYLGERWTVYAEALAGRYPWNGDGDAFGASVGGGATWAGDPEGAWGVDVAAYGAMTRSAPDLLAVLRVWAVWRGAEAP